MMMPGINGIELARIIKANPTIAPRPLMMLTSAAQYGDQKPTNSAAISCCLSKPIQQFSLHPSIAAMLGFPVEGRPQDVQQRCRQTLTTWMADIQPPSRWWRLPHMPWKVSARGILKQEWTIISLSLSPINELSKIHTGSPPGDTPRAGLQPGCLAAP